MALRHSALILSFILTAMADQDVPTVFPMETISCALQNSQKGTLYYCNLWRNRMKEEGFSAIKCEGARDNTGKGMWACTPKWIRQNKKSDKTIFMSYIITKNKDQTLHMHAVINYPQSNLTDVIFPLIILVILVLACCCMAHMDPPPDLTDNGGLSFSDAFLAASLANSWHDSGSSGPEWGGEDYSYKWE